MDTPALIPVESSILKEVGYDPGSLKLFVKFRSGRVYIYEGVPENLYRQMIVAKSVGSFFVNKIKGHFDFDDALI